MDSSEKFVRLSSNLLECCEIFNSLFGEIVLIRNSSVDGVLSESILPAREIDESLLSADQKHAIKQVAGLLMDISQVVSCDNSYSSDIASLHEILTRQTLMERKHKRTIAALQDYLALELTRSEELESKLKAKETELVSVSEERNKYVRLSQQVTSSGSQSQSSKSSILPSKTKGEEKEPFNPKDWIGRYIRKSFGTSYYFGAVASFDPPYFKVIYEDADVEELTKSEVSRLFWIHSVPSQKVQQVDKHVKKLLLEQEANSSDFPDAPKPSTNLKQEINGGSSSQVMTFDQFEKLDETVVWYAKETKRPKLDT